MKVKALFVNKISGLAIIKIIDGSTYTTLLVKLKFTCKKAVLEIQRRQEKKLCSLSPKRDDRDSRYKIPGVL